MEFLINSVNNYQFFSVNSPFLALYPHLTLIILPYSKIRLVTMILEK